MSSAICYETYSRRNARMIFVNILKTGFTFNFYFTEIMDVVVVNNGSVLKSDFNFYFLFYGNHEVVIVNNGNYYILAVLAFQFRHNKHFPVGNFCVACIREV